jgi:RND family efflux transporter MFP subunit
VIDSRLLFAFLAIPLAGCAASAAKVPDKKPPEVMVTTPVADEVADYQDFTGRLDALKTVDIRARASGFILSAPFKEGDMVQEGELLFLIDPTTYRADYNLAEANLRLAKADENLQQKNAIRARELIKTNAMAREDYETTLAACEKSQATVAAMGATRDRAKEYLEYTKVIAPWTGRVSRRLVDPGNLVNADQTVLTTLVKDDQLYAYFDVDERTFLSLSGSGTPAESASAAKLQFPVLLQLANEDHFSRTGVVNFVDNRVAANTGTIRMRAIFDNPGGALRAGLFVRIRLPVGASYQALLVPSESVLSDQGRKYVYVVGGNNEVEYRKVSLGQEIAGLRVIRQAVVKDGKAVEGVVQGEKVITTGMQRVRPGALVHATVQEPPQPPGSPLGKLLNNAKSAKTVVPAEKQHAGQPEPAATKADRAPTTSTR